MVILGAEPLPQPADLVGSDRAAEAFELELAGGCSLDGLVDGCEDPLADQDLPRRRVNAEALAMAHDDGRATRSPEGNSHLSFH
jgi:hypothetical protein